MDKVYQRAQVLRRQAKGTLGFVFGGTLAVLADVVGGIQAAVSPGPPAGGERIGVLAGLPIET